MRWKNNLALWVVPEAWLAPLPQFVQSWLANCVLCYIEYALSGALWALWIYKCAPTRSARSACAHRTRARARSAFSRKCTHACLLAR